MDYNPASAIIYCDLGVRVFFFFSFDMKVTISRCLKCGRNINKCFIGFMSFNTHHPCSIEEDIETQEVVQCFSKIDILSMTLRR